MVMTIARVSLALGCLASCAVAAQAGSGVSIQTKHYSIYGATGAELYASMVKRGPRSGYTAKAIANTHSRFVWNESFKSTGDACRVMVRPTLTIIYTYPKPENAVSPALKRSWNRFMASVRKHEEKHGRVARTMFESSARSLRQLSTSGDPSCARTRAEFKRRTAEAFRVFEERQKTFDKVEHQYGGNVDRIVKALKAGG